ncbi:MAG TPA: peptidase U32 family protein [Spirochaetota bacterium]|nr:peptidase U32 family protein [Spirochaetota bacterium]
MNRGVRPAIASPAGTLEKLEAAVRFGADEVYFGGKAHNLRSQSGNLSLDEIGRACDFCRERGVRTTFLLNSFLHENDVGGARAYIDEVRAFAFDAYMVSDPGMLMLLRDAGVETPVHLSTQMSTLNHPAARFWERQGVSRIVLAREVTLGEIRAIREHTGAELEVFVHGALCVSYSGRCLLSRFLSGRDANTGGCSHPCRWRYALVEEKREGNHMEIVEHARGTEILSSKDLCLIERIPEYVEAGVDAFKIEGRMKSLYYTANVTRVYRHAAEVAAGGGDYLAHLPRWIGELDLVSHRPYTADLWNEFEGMRFDGVPYVRKTLFMGYATGPGEHPNEVRVKTHNPIRTGDEIEAIFPVLDGDAGGDFFSVMEINEEEKSVAMAQPGKVYLFKLDKAVRPDAVFRKRIEDDKEQARC